MPETLELTVNSDNTGNRIDKAIPSLQPKISRTLAQKFIKAGNILVNGKICDSISYKVSENDIISINDVFNEAPDPTDTKIEANPDIKLNIIYEDKYLLVVNKQAGLTVHPGAGNHKDTLVNALLAKYDARELSSVAGGTKAGIVHRLDRDTTGALLIAKDNFTHRELANQIKERVAKRIYHALVWNKPHLMVGKVETFMGRHHSDRKKRSVYKSSGKHALTNYKLLHTYFDGALSLMEIQLDTGRTHQIRVHMEHINMPVVGDKTYHGNQNQKKIGSLPDKIKDDILNFPRQALHAREIIFTHPHTLEEMHFTADYPKDIKGLLKILK